MATPSYNNMTANSCNCIKKLVKLNYTLTQKRLWNATKTGASHFFRPVGLEAAGGRGWKLLTSLTANWCSLLDGKVVGGVEYTNGYPSNWRIMKNCLVQISINSEKNYTIQPKQKVNIFSDLLIKSCWRCWL